MMPDFVISVRRRRRGRFVAEPGRTRFLVVPGGALPAPGQAVRSRSAWLASLLAAGDGRSVLVFVHGYASSLGDVMWRHRRLESNLRAAGFTGSLVSFDWPSADCTLNYLEDRDDAKATALALVRDGIALICRRGQDRCDVAVHVLAHSMGAYVVREAFDDADDRRALAEVNWSVAQMVFVAADVSRRSLSESDARSRSLYRHCARLTNYSNPYDAALAISNVKRIGVAPRAGRVGLPEDAPRKAVDVDCGAHWSELNEDAAERRGRFDHSWHFGDGVFVRDLAATLRGQVDRHRLVTRRVLARNRTELVSA